MFTGREYDREIMLYYNRARYYDVNLGRFISRDPIGIVDDVNLYSYTANSPVGSIDRMGLSGKPIVEQAFNIWDTFEQLKALKDALVQSWGKSLFRGGGVVAGVSAPICASTVSVTGECGIVAISDTPIVLPFCYISGVSAGTSCGITGLGVGVAMIGNQMQSSNGGGNGGGGKSSKDSLDLGGGFKVNREQFHKVDKPNILKDLGNSFQNKVGNNPDVTVGKNGNIILKGVGDVYKGKTLETGLKAEWYFNH